MNSPPKTPKNTEEIVSSGPPNRRLRKTSWLSMGDALRRSHTMKMRLSTTPAISRVSVMLEVQPASGAAIMPYTSRAGPKIERISPKKSRREECFFEDSGASIRHARNATAIIGTLIRKIDPHEKLLSSSPPTMGPSGIPSEDIPTQIPRALARSWSGKISRISARVEGIINADPRPIITREKISTSALIEKAASIEPSSKINIPARKLSLCPILSARPPKKSSGAANASE